MPNDNNKYLPTYASPYQQTSKEAAMGAEPEEYKKSTSQQIREALLALSGIAGTATNITATSYGRQAPFQQPFGSYEEAVQRSGQEAASALKQREEWEQRGRDWQRWAPGETREATKFAQQQAERPLDIKGKQLGVLSQQMGVEKASRGLEEEKFPVFSAERDRLMGVIKNPKATEEERKDAMQRLRELQAGKLVEEPGKQGLLFSTPRKETPIEVPSFSKRPLAPSEERPMEKSVPLSFAEKLKGMFGGGSSSQPQDMVRVRIKATGQTGKVPRSQFNPGIYEEIK